MSSEQAGSNVKNEAHLKTILLVEDDEDIGEFIAQALNDETPYTVLHVTDGKRALESAGAIKPSLFILDFQLPGMNGIELHDRLHAVKELEAIPTLIVSANFPSRKEMQQRQIAFLKKPFDLNDLFKIIEKLLPE